MSIQDIQNVNTRCTSRRFLTLKKLYFTYVDGTEFYYGSYQNYELAFKVAKSKKTLFSKGLYKII